MNELNRARSAALVLRVGLGIIYLAHSVYLKGMVFGLDGTAQFFGSLGLPPLLAYVVFTLEAIGGAALILGFHSRYVALALVPVALGATWAHFGAGWVFSNSGGGWEYPAFLALATAVQALLGDGAASVRNLATPRELARAA